MNITFLIGNGFDLNLGLQTKYSHFVNEYKNIISPSNIIEEFKRDIKDSEPLWSNAEIAIGQYTKKFKKGEGEKFSECHSDFCNELSKYLKHEQDRINYDSQKKKIAKMGGKLNSLSENFPTLEKNILGEVGRIRIAEDRVYNFLSFNYTYTLENCLAVIGENQNIIGTHQYNGRTYHRTIGVIHHVHGTVDGEMVFGVNDESQIANPEIFDYEYGDIDKEMLIKIQANAAHMQNIDKLASDKITNSHLIYVYGMSISPTDALWWNRLCVWLNKDIKNQLIIHSYELPLKGIVQTQYRKAEKKLKNYIVSFSNLTDGQKKNILNQIHLTNYNIFDEIKDLAGQSEVEKLFFDDVLLINDSAKKIG